jgi:molybdopterin converting factor small subunit
MVKVRFLNLLRSKYNIDTLWLKPGTIYDILNQILSMYPHINIQDLKSAVIFINQEKIMHLDRFNTITQADDEIIFTHFVGGG